MKVYLLYEVRYEMPYAFDTVLAVYDSLYKAEIARDALITSNTEPVDADCYGPMRGIEYVVEEWEVV